MLKFGVHRMKATYCKYTLRFKRPSGTSRGVMTHKESWFLILQEGGAIGIGECGLLRGLSSDDVPGYESQLRSLCKLLSKEKPLEIDLLHAFPSIRFGLEQAQMGLTSASPFELFPTKFTKGSDQIPINGLIWMGDPASMRHQIQEKLNTGFSCIKLKIGALDFKTELGILQAIRKEYTASEIELRVDANGAFSPGEALEKLKRLSEFNLHSIEQPIRQGQWDQMARLCASSPVPIALDEELIGINDVTQRQQLLQTIRPQYLILKPSLLGGYRSCEEWIKLGENTAARWWVTSALESNIGLNAIAQWTYTLGNPLPQGLGTGGLYTNNFSSPLTVEKGQLSYNPDKTWSDKILEELCT